MFVSRKFTKIFVDFYCISVYNKTIILVYNYTRRVLMNLLDTIPCENEDIEKQYEEYMLDILYKSGYMEH
jgi:hypothetical protein